MSENSYECACTETEPATLPGPTGGPGRAVVGSTDDAVCGDGGGHGGDG